MAHLLVELRARHRDLAGREARNVRAAVRLFCLACMGGTAGEVERCTVTGCPLYPHRSGQMPEPLR